MKFNKLTNKIKLSSALITATTIVGGSILSVPLFLFNNINNKIISNNSDYKNIIDQDNKQTTGSSDFSSQPAEIKDFFSIYDNKKIYINNSSNSLFAVVTKEDGYDVLYAWGNNSYGQLGLSGSYYTYPTLVPILQPNLKINHVQTCTFVTTIVINDNEIWTTGYKTNDGHGNPDLNNAEVFTKNDKWEGGIVKSIYGGTSYRVVVTVDDQVWVWGRNDYGQLGKGDKINQPIPLNITTIIAAAIPKWASGKFYTSTYNTAMLVDGQLYMWGAGSSGRLGNDGEVDVVAPPKEPVTLANKIVNYSMSSFHSLAFLANGELYSWGWNMEGRLGINSDIDKALLPVRVTTMLGDEPISGVTDVFTSSDSSYIQIGNTIYSCGSKYKGILAQGEKVINNKIFSPVILDPSAKINNIYTTSGNLIVNLTTGLHMAGSNENGEFANGNKGEADNYILTQVTPFGHIKPITKTNNKKYVADVVVADLTNKTTVQEIRNALAKYIEGIDSLPLESTLSYVVQPIASTDNSEVNLTLKINRSFNDDGAKISGDLDIPIKILNLRITESTIIIKTIPTGVHTGNIQKILNPNPESTPSSLWLNEIIDMNEFPDGTTFIKITDDIINPGTGIDGTYEGNIVVSQYFVNGGTISTSEKSFPFKFEGLTKVADSSIVNLPIPSGYDIDNIEASLIEGTTIKKDELSKFIDINRFPTNATFTIGIVNKDFATRKFVFEIIPSHHYVGGIYVDNSTAKTSYWVTIQFAVPPNLGLIIGLSVGGVALAAIISFGIWWKLKRKRFASNI